MFLHNYIDDYDTFFRLLKVIVIAIIVTSQAVSKYKSWFSFDNWKFAEKWGKRTYGIYMLHPFCITILDVLFRVVGFDYNSYFAIHLLIVSITFIFTLALIEFSYIYFESRFLRYKKKFR